MKMSFIKKLFLKNQKLRAWVYIVVIYAIFIIWLFVFLIERQYNPNERNYIVFKNDKIENVIDSMYSFLEIAKNYPFPAHPKLELLYFSYYNEMFF